MKVTVLRNIGLLDLKRFGLIDTDNKPTRDDLTEGNEVEVDKSLGEKLIKEQLATQADVKGEAKAPEVKGVK